jgi:uncharacterized protein
MRPIFRISTNEKDITENVKARLISLVLEDKSNLDSDTVTIILDDRPTLLQAHLAFPDIGDELTVSIGYLLGSLVEVGKFNVCNIAYQDGENGAQLTVMGNAVPLHAAIRSPISRSWHKKTLGEIVSTIAGEFQLSHAVEARLSQIAIAHEDQNQESPLSFLARLAMRYDAVFKLINRSLVLVGRQSFNSATGKAFPEITLTPRQLSSWSFTYEARKEAGAAQKSPMLKGSAGGVMSTYWDYDKAELIQLYHGQPPYQQIRYSLADSSTSMAQGKAMLKKASREKGMFSCVLPGLPEAMAEQKLVLKDFRQEIPKEWSIINVTHRINNSGFISQITAQVLSE